MPQKRPNKSQYRRVLADCRLLKTKIRRSAVCFLKGLCNQCPAWSWMENNSLDAPVKYLCEVPHEQARYLGLLNKGEKAWQVKNYQERIDRFVNKDKDDA